MSDQDFYRKATKRQWSEVIQNADLCEECGINIKAGFRRIFQPTGNLPTGHALPVSPSVTETRVETDLHDTTRNLPTGHALPVSPSVTETRIETGLHDITRNLPTGHALPVSPSVTETRIETDLHDTTRNLPTAIALPVSPSVTETRVMTNLHDTTRNLPTGHALPVSPSVTETRVETDLLDTTRNLPTGHALPVSPSVTETRIETGLHDTTRNLPTGHALPVSPSVTETRVETDLHDTTRNLPTAIALRVPTHLHDTTRTPDLEQMPLESNMANTAHGPIRRRKQSVATRIGQVSNNSQDLDWIIKTGQRLITEWGRIAKSKSSFDVPSDELALAVGESEQVCKTGLETIKDAWAGTAYYKLPGYLLVYFERQVADIQNAIDQQIPEDINPARKVFDKLQSLATLLGVRAANIQEEVAIKIGRARKSTVTKWLEDHQLYPEFMKEWEIVAIRRNLGLFRIEDWLDIKNRLGITPHRCNMMLENVKKWSNNLSSLEVRSTVYKSKCGQKYMEVVKKISGKEEADLEEAMNKSLELLEVIHLAVVGIVNQHESTPLHNH